MAPRNDQNARAVVYLTSTPEPGYYVAADNEAQGALSPSSPSPAVRTISPLWEERHSCSLTLRVLGIHKALALHPDIKIEVIDAGEWNSAVDGYNIGAQIAERSSDER